jgi:hypothetical protein
MTASKMSGSGGLSGAVCMFGSATDLTFIPYRIVVVARNGAGRAAGSFLLLMSSFASVGRLNSD